jgi:hypothetical protein
VSSPRAIAYVTDLEGRWEKLEAFVRDNPDVSLDAGGRLQVRDGAVFVFGGDAVDRGAHGRRLDQPDRVVLIAGNRDLNKLRLARELHGHPPDSTPDELRRGPRAPLLRWILERTMGASQAFGHRKVELAATGAPADDEAVAASFLDDVADGGPLAAYLAECQLGFIEGSTLVLHGAVTAESLGVVPYGAPRTTDPRAWVERLNAFCRSQVAAFLGASPAERTGPRPAWQPIVDYQAPVRGRGANQASVVYDRPVDGAGRPCLPEPDVVRTLVDAGLARVLLGHTPSGDCPALLRAPGFAQVLADNSYGRIETGSQVRVSPDGEVTGAGQTVLDDGTRTSVRWTLPPDHSGPLGLRDPEGTLVKGRLASGELLLFRYLGRPGHVTQTASPEDAVASRSLTPPWPDDRP